MKRIETLIQNLQEQLHNHANSAQLLATAELLVDELKQNIVEIETTSTVEIEENSNKVVLLEELEEINENLTVNSQGTLEVIDAEKVQNLEQPAIIDSVEINNDQTPAFQDHIEEPKPFILRKPTQILVNPEEYYSDEPKIEFKEVIENIPNLATQPAQEKQVFELNEIMVDEEENFNDLLKAPVVEVAQSIKETPIKDLRKGIDVNNKYLFINELFNADEEMYNKCIKTINSFAVYPEAETWIRRELVIRMGWNEKAHSTQQFYQIVSRRFAESI